MLTMSYILSADATVYYEEYGTGEPLVLIPGLLGTVESHWRRFIPEYAKHFHTIAVDLRGHGRTNNPSRRLLLSQCVDDLHVLLDTLEIERALLCGYDFGGYLALAYTLRHPGTVRGLVVHATPLSWNMDAVTAAIHPERTVTLQQDHLPGNGPTGWSDLLQASRPLLESLSHDGLTENGLRTLACPVLVTLCEGDDVVPHAEAERLAAAMPQGRLHIFGTGQHSLHSIPKQPFVEVTSQFFLSCIVPTPG
jgi:pimeloyl-ACP methyl ester carboxylesterase